MSFGSILDATVFPKHLALLASRAVRAPASDDELAARQSALQAEAAALLDELDRSGIFSDIGPPEVTGSYISNLMCWRELDVCFLVGADYSPRDVGSRETSSLFPNPIASFGLLALVWTVVAILVVVITGQTDLSRKYRKQEEALPTSEPVSGKRGV